MRTRTIIGIGASVALAGLYLMIDAGVDRMPPTPEGGGPAEVHYRPAMIRLPVESQPWFVMGSPPDEPGRGNDEKLQRVRMTMPFAIGETEVTQGQWAAVMERNPSWFHGPPFSAGREVDQSRPVERVSWYEAVSYLNALSELEGLPLCYELIDCAGTFAGGCSLLELESQGCLGDFTCAEVRFAGQACRGYRLPTEAEWEYAARAGTTEATYIGPLDFRSAHDAPVLDAIAWYGGNSELDGGALCGPDENGDRRMGCGTHAVASLRPNAWGLYDMLGNVSEWTADWETGRARSNGGLERELATAVPLRVLDGRRGLARVVRGCCWNDPAQYCRMAVRGRGAPASRSAYLGFRLARSYPSSLEPSDPRPDDAADAAP